MCFQYDRLKIRYEELASEKKAIESQLLNSRLQVQHFEGQSKQDSVRQGEVVQMQKSLKELEVPIQSDTSNTHTHMHIHIHNTVCRFKLFRLAHCILRRSFKSKDEII